MRFTFSTSSKAYSPLPQSECQAASLHGFHTRPSKARSLTKWILGGTTILLAVGFAAHNSVPLMDALRYSMGECPSAAKVLTSQQLIALESGNRSISVGGDRRLRIIMHADSSHINLCKSVASAVALGYPAPILSNWGGEFSRPDWHLSGRHLAKIESFLSVIEDMLALAGGEDSDVHEDDLVVLVDAHDVWFQLPPTVLIQRYHQLNREADDKVRHQWQDLQGVATDFPIEPPKHSIVVTGADACHPKTGSGDRPHHQHRPDSSMRSGKYGDGMEKLLTKNFHLARISKTKRSQCAKSGMVMGTMGSLRDALIRAKDQARAESFTQISSQFWTDKALFGEVLNNQETWRQWMLELGTAWNGSASETHLPRLPRAVRNVAMAAMKGERFEYGIGIDYAHSTILPTSSKDDEQFIKIGDKQALQEASAKAGVPRGEIRVGGIPAELEQDNVGAEYLRSIKWAIQPLYTNLFSGVTPSAVHPSACGPSLDADHLNEWWSKMWFYSHLRSFISQALLPIHSRSAVRPLARIPTPGDGNQTTRYWVPKTDLHNKLAKIFEPAPHRAKSGGSYVPIAMEGVCQHGGKKAWHEELFGDEKGPWQL